MPDYTPIGYDAADFREELLELFQRCSFFEQKRLCNTLAFLLEHKSDFTVEQVFEGLAADLAHYGDALPDHYQDLVDATADTFIDPETGYPEGVAVCDLCGRAEPHDHPQEEYGVWPARGYPHHDTDDDPDLEPGIYLGEATATDPGRVMNAAEAKEYARKRKEEEESGEEEEEPLFKVVGYIMFNSDTESWEPYPDPLEQNDAL